MLLKDKTEKTRIHFSKKEASGAAGITAGKDKQKKPWSYKKRGTKSPNHKSLKQKSSRKNVDKLLQKIKAAKISADQLLSAYSR